MRKLKNFSRAIIAIAMMLITAFDSLAYDFEVDGIYYNISSSTDMTAKVTYGNSYNSYAGTVTIPSTVTYRGNSYLVTGIGYEAFKSCSGLTSVTIPNSLTSIDEYAFKFCRSLTSVTIGNSVTEIGNKAFYDCSGLTEINITDLSAWCKINFADVLANPLYYAHHLKLNGTEITNLIIPDDITEIKAYTFSCCTSFASVTIHNSVTEINEDAFYSTDLTEVNIFDLSAWCKIDFGNSSANPLISTEHFNLNGSEITDLVIPDDVTSIKAYAFYGCNFLTSVTIGNSVTSIGVDAFYNSGLTEVNFNAEYCTGSIFNGCFYLKTLNIGNNVKYIPGHSFYNCRRLTSVTIPNSVTSIGEGAFYECTSLTEVNFNAENCTSMGSSSNPVFGSCTNLKTVNIGENVKEIPRYAFYGCTRLTEVNISDLSAWCKIDFGDYYANPLQYAGHLKLNGTEITNLVIPDDLTEIKAYAFSGCSGLISVTIPNSVTYISDTSFKGCSGLVEMIVEEGNPNYFSYEGVIYRTSDSCPIFAPLGMGKYVVPNFIDHVYLCSSSGFEVKSVEIPEGFAATSVHVGGNCTSLESLVINEPLDTITFSGSFGNAVNLKKLVLPTKMDCKSLLFLYSTKRVEIGTYDYRYTYTLPPIEILQIPSLSILKHIDINFDYDDELVNGLSYGSCQWSNSNGNSYARPIWLPRSLKQLIITNQSDFNYKDSYNYTYYYIFEYTGAIDGYSIDILKPVTNFRSRIFQNSAVRTVAIDSAEIPAEFFKGCAKLKSLTLPFPGIGTAQTTSNFGELFGTESNSNMRAVTQYFEDGTNKTYYLPTGLEELVLTEGCEMIPYGGLYNCNMLKKLTLPTSLYMVGDKALYGCAQIADIYCKGADPAVAYDSSFDGMRLTSCKLHVPYNSSERYKISDGWKRFYYIEEEAPLVVSIAKNIENAGVVYGINEYQPGQVAEVEAVAHSGYTFIGWYENWNLLTTDSKYTVMVTESHSLVAMFAPVLDENDVEVSPKAENVTLTWAQETGAEYYNIDIYSNAAMTMPVGSIVVDNSGQPVSRSATAVSATIDGLSELQNYYYSITAYGAEETILSKYTGSFSTIAGVEGVMGDTNAVEVARYDIHGRLLSEPTKGINIVKYSDGTVKKIIHN